MTDAWMAPLHSTFQPGQLLTEPMDEPDAQVPTASANGPAESVPDPVAWPPLRAKDSGGAEGHRCLRDALRAVSADLTSGGRPGGTPSRTQRRRRDCRGTCAARWQGPWCRGGRGRRRRRRTRRGTARPRTRRWCTAAGRRGRSRRQRRRRRCRPSSCRGGTRRRAHPPGSSPDRNPRPAPRAPVRPLVNMGYPLDTPNLSFYRNPYKFICCAPRPAPPTETRAPRPRAPPSHGYPAPLAGYPDNYLRVPQLSCVCSSSRTL